MTPSTSSIAAQRWRTGLGLGLAFCLGILVFVILFQWIDRWNIAPPPLDPPERRVAGGLEMPLLADPGSPPWSLKDHAGQVVVVNYFATWCEPCLRELPDLHQLVQDYAPRGVVLVAVAIDADGEQRPGVGRETVLRQFAQDHALPFPILLPAADSALMMMRPPVPQTFVYDRHGRRARIILGGIPRQNLPATLEALLAEK